MKILLIVLGGWMGLSIAIVPLWRRWMERRDVDHDYPLREDVEDVEHTRAIEGERQKPRKKAS